MLRDKSMRVPLWDRLPEELVVRVVALAEPRALVTLVFIERRARDASQPRLTALGALRLPPCSLRVHGPPGQPYLGACTLSRKVSIFGAQWNFPLTLASMGQC